jgi:Replication-relaxation
MRMELIIALVQALRGAARIVVALAVFDYLTAEQITRLLFAEASLSYVRKLLKDLEVRSLVQPLPRQTASQPRLYTLTAKGYRYASILGVETVKRVRKGEEQVKGRNDPFVLHTIAVTDVLISAWLLSQTVPGIVLNRLYRERELKRKIYVPVAGRTLCLEPDASVQFFLSGRWQEFIHFEIYRTHLSERRFKQKIQGYAAYIESPVHRELFHTPALSIAVIAQTAELATRLKRWTEAVLQELQQPELGGQFFFASCNPATATSDVATASLTELFLAPVWQQAFGQVPTPLLVLEDDST